MVRLDGEVYPVVAGAALTGYFWHAASAQQRFARFDDARAYVRETLIQQVKEEVKAAGATSAVAECQEQQIWAGMSRFDAWAVGEPGLGQANS